LAFDEIIKLEVGKRAGTLCFTRLSWIPARNRCGNDDGEVATMSILFVYDRYLLLLMIVA
jgi:hypothetical protein